MNVDREKLLVQLESVQPGLSNREIVEQSSCFVFKDGRVFTYNDEIACSIECDINATGAVQAAPMLGLLRKLLEETLIVEVNENELTIAGKKRQAGLRFEQEILLQVDKVEVPTKWKKLPKNFSEAIQIVQSCASKDESQERITCVHVSSQYVEAFDNFQMARYSIEMPIKKDFLVRRDSIKHITSLGMKEFSETSQWIHFRNPTGLVLSCRRFEEDYPTLDRLISQPKGEPITLPKGLADAADKANIFSSENTEHNLLVVDIRPGKLRILGEGISGWYKERRSIKYNGRPIKFLLEPSLLIELTKRHNDCMISDDSLRVEGGSFVYITCLAAPKKEEVGV